MKDDNILDCGHPPSPHRDFTTGYGVDENDKKACFECCAEQDKEWMRTHDRMTLYLTDHELTNWPGSFRIPVKRFTVGRHNFAGKRYDCQVEFEGALWHFTQYGDNTQIAHGRKLKRAKT